MSLKYTVFFLLAAIVAGGDKYPGPVNPTLISSCSTCSVGATVNFDGTGYFAVRNGGYGLSATGPSGRTDFGADVNYQTGDLSSFWTFTIPGSYEVCTYGGETPHHFSLTLACLQIEVQ